MSENIFQILLLLSYLDIALISITIAVYAISVSYLGRETSRSISRRKRRVTELKETIGSLSTRIRDDKEIDAIQKEIAYYKKQQRGLEGSLLWLSVKGAVFGPTAFFSASLLLCVFGILEVWNPEILLILSSVLVIIGGICLGTTLKSTEKAALEIPRPKYEVFFRSSELMTKRCKADTPTSVELVVHNIGDESSENPLIVAYFPKGIDVKRTPSLWSKSLAVSKAQPSGEFSGSYSRSARTLNVDAFQQLQKFDVVAKQGTYKIPVVIKDKVSRSTFELVLRVE